MLYLILKNKFKITTLWFLLWGSLLYSQDNLQYIELIKIKNPSLKSTNPSFLREIKDTILFTAKTYFKYKKGEFKNYFEPTKNKTIGIDTESYNRLNPKTVLYGYVNYEYSKAKNSGGTTFLNPYRTPFNFTPKDETTKGERKIEKYQLVGGLSYDLFSKLPIGLKVDYKTVSFVKIKDMRNINNILDLTIENGLNYKLFKDNHIGISYSYNRYIENLRINEYGKSERDYHALVNNGTFRGFFNLYGDEGILDTKFKRKPWVDLVHHYAVQYESKFSGKVLFFTELKYNKGKGYYGNDADNDIIYMRHKKKTYLSSSTLQINLKNTEHIFNVNWQKKIINNNKQLFTSKKKDEGNFITTYYGETNMLIKEDKNLGFGYTFLTKNNNPLLISVSYDTNNILRLSNNFPFHREQNIFWNSANIEIAKTFKFRDMLIYLKQSQFYRKGYGGNPIDGKYLSNTGNTKLPDNLDNLLHKEREYLTAKRFVSTSTLRFSKDFKHKNIFLELNNSYLISDKLEHLKGNSYEFGVTLGLGF